MKSILFCESQNCDCLKNHENTHENLHLCKTCEYYNPKKEQKETEKAWYDHEKDEKEHEAW